MVSSFYVIEWEPYSSAQPASIEVLKQRGGFEEVPSDWECVSHQGTFEREALHVGLADFIGVPLCPNGDCGGAGFRIVRPVA